MIFPKIGPAHDRVLNKIEMVLIKIAVVRLSFTQYLNLGFPQRLQKTIESTKIRTSFGI